MSFKSSLSIECDHCGASHSIIEQRANTRTAFWALKHWAEDNHWLRLSRGKFYLETHLCKACADSGIAVPKAKRATANKYPATQEGEPL